MRNCLATLLFGIILLFAGCSDRPERAPAIGEAYAGPATLVLRNEIALKSGTAATVHHGERLEILRVRRAFVLVRTPSGAEGWVNSRELLTAAEMEDLRRLEDQGKSLPSQGAASTFDVLNVHSAPDRRSPSFLQVKEGMRMEVLAHRVTPRSSAPAAQRKLLPDPPKPARRAARKPKETPKFPKPPMPPAPKPPANWLEMSKRPVGLEEDPPAEVPPVPMDDWSLVRTQDGRSGWVLTSRLYMGVPDEVAQYAEGKRITSYFSLGEVQDGDQKKHHWLWTTLESGLQPYEFDGFRVFIWSLRRHRYETAYRERNLKGYYPVLLHTVELATPVRKGAPPQAVKYPGFSLLVEKEDGSLYRRNYAFIGNIVRFAGEVRQERAQTDEQQRGLGTMVASGKARNGSQSSFVDRLTQKAASWRKRLLGK